MILFIPINKTHAKVIEKNQDSERKDESLPGRRELQCEELNKQKDESCLRSLEDVVSLLVRSLLLGHCISLVYPLPSQCRDEMKRVKKIIHDEGQILLEASCTGTLHHRM